ncbi:MAG: hypothetical protein A2V81_00575 [Candidatus Abawacabacteria bacterium RBG_16_42_10]|uniref:AB hydrolase-1 domain-containing protein n=1 Tax=Candidatus Abawacabacteria bacterium RBG_16_42_10 TaxID=1817814 RepID=A0A1F4XKP8_9BACT|nr:MAG: hypothetical protein A2V81_00575 [Candidatus Abawacabacteria bacterium RBG_16_42_10]
MTFFIIPGFGQKTSDPVWQQIKKMVMKHHKNLVMVQPGWKRRTLTDWVEDLNAVRKQYPEPHYLLGFSYGAMTAFVSGIQLPAKAQVLCSLSPYFEEDLLHTRAWWSKIVGKKRMQDFTKYNFKKLAARSKAKTWLLIGEKESPEIFQRLKATKKIMPHWHVEVVSGAKHDISDQNYVVLLEKVLRNI